MEVGNEAAEVENVAAEVEEAKEAENVAVGVEEAKEAENDAADAMTGDDRHTGNIRARNPRND